MKELIELSKKIEDKELRKMVVDFLNDLSLSNKHFKKYPKMKIEEAGALFGAGGGATVERDVLNHTISLVKLCEKCANVLEEVRGLKLNKDNLIAAGILHDLMKVFEWKRGKMGLEHTGILLDHTMLGVAELYHRGFPEEVIHIVASHFGEAGPTPPRNFEALIFHRLDSMLSLVEYRMAGASDQQEEIQLLLLGDEMIKKLKESGGEVSGIDKKSEPGERGPGKKKSESRPKKSGQTF